jgi:uncharacterized membrane protein
MQQSASSRAERRSILLTGVLIGIGLIASLDEALLHQVLQWHTLVWGTDERGRILSDGVLHVLSVALFVWGLVRVSSVPSSVLRHGRRSLLGATLIGAGAFNLYDGLIDHLALHLHLVNEFVCPDPQANNSLATCPADLPYEIVWLVIAVAILAAGLSLWRRDV